LLIQGKKAGDPPRGRRRQDTRLNGMGSAYGAAGSLALLLLWVDYSSLILLFGAAFTRARFEARGNRIRARNGAVRVHRELVDG